MAEEHDADKEGEPQENRFAYLTQTVKYAPAPAGLLTPNLQRLGIKLGN